MQALPERCVLLQQTGDILVVFACGVDCDLGPHVPAIYYDPMYALSVVR